MKVGTIIGGVRCEVCDGTGWAVETVEPDGRRRLLPCSSERFESILNAPELGERVKGICFELGGNRARAESLRLLLVGYFNAAEYHEVPCEACGGTGYSLRLVVRQAPRRAV